MGVNNETLYLKIEQNTIVYDRHVVLNDIAKMECTNETVLRQLKYCKDGVHERDGSASVKTEKGIQFYESEK